MLKGGGHTLNHMLISNKKRTQVEILSDCSFFIYLITELVFKYTIIGKLAIMLFIGSVFLLCYEKKILKGHYYFVFSILFILYNYWNIIIGVSVSPVISYTMLTTLCINCIMLFFIFNYFIIRNDMQKIINIYISAIFILSLFLVIISLPNIFAVRLGKNLGISYNVLAIAAAVAFIMSAYNYTQYKQKRSILLCIWSLITIMLTGSRKGLLQIVLSVIVYLYLKNPRKRLRSIVVAGILLLLTYISIMNIPILYQLIGIRFKAIAEFISGSNIEEASLNSRLHYINLGWQYIIQNPWKGYGLDCFRTLPGAFTTYSHNNFIELLFSGGIPALILYYIPNIIILIQSYRTTRNGSLKMKLFFAVSLILVFIDYGIVSYYERLMLMFLIMTMSTCREERGILKVNLYEQGAMLRQ